MITCEVNTVRGGGYCVIVRDHDGTVINQPYVMESKEEAEERKLVEIEWVNRQNQAV